VKRNLFRRKAGESAPGAPARGRARGGTGGDSRGAQKSTIEIPQMCSKCRRALTELAARAGGAVFCSHRSGSPGTGVFVAAIPTPEGGNKMHIVYPCSEQAAREKSRELHSERRQAAARR